MGLDVEHKIRFTHASSAAYCKVCMASEDWPKDNIRISVHIKCAIETLQQRHFYKRTCVICISKFGAELKVYFL